jgi:hypothetical protein
MTKEEMAQILIDDYDLSELEFSLGATIEDLRFGLMDFIENNLSDIETMILEDRENPSWDD